MLRRSLVVAGVLGIAAALAAPALALRVHVRVEGARTTIFGPTRPLVTPVSRTFTPPDGPAVAVSKPTPIGALERASRIGEFYYRVKSFSFGPYVDRIGRRAGGGSTGWVFKVNNASPPVGADAYRLKAGDDLLWYFARFGPSGGPKTLAVARLGGGCFRAHAYDDNGTRTSPSNVTFLRDGRFVGSASGRICLRGEWHTLRALKQEMVRSAVLTRP